MENDVEDKIMESTLLERDSDEISEYERGIFDILVALLKSTGIKEKNLKEYTKDIALRKIRLKDILNREGIEIIRTQALFSEDLIEYPDAVSNISQYMVDFGVDMETASEDALLEGYKTFAKVFEKLLEIFNDDIKKYLNVNGRKIGALISMTYVTLRVLYKGNLIQKQITMVKSASFFGLNACAIKRLIYRFRKSKKSLMRYVENNNIFTLDEVFERIESMRDS